LRLIAVPIGEKPKRPGQFLLAQRVLAVTCSNRQSLANEHDTIVQHASAESGGKRFVANAIAPCCAASPPGTDALQPMPQGIDGVR
jgi:hypothetical protein